jgi:asparagine synthetase B (glutamine-hydrolysing)
VVNGESIKSMGIKMVLSGEGADEFLSICISTKRQMQEFHEENVRN